MSSQYSWDFPNDTTIVPNIYTKESDGETWKNPIIELCRDADLELVVGEVPAQRIRVSRTTLCMASPVFRAMLAGKFAEARLTKIRLEGDDSDAMLIVLRIAHLRFSEVQRSFRDDESLVNVATLCDKYGMVAICRPFIPGWLDDKHAFPFSCSNAESLWVLWVFGYETEFTKIAKKLSLSIYIDDRGNCKTPKHTLLEDLMPPGMTDSLLKVRSDAISAMLNEIESWIETYATNKETCNVRFGARRDHRASMFAQNCQAFYLGQLIRGSAKLSTWPSRPATFKLDSYSVSDIYDILKAMKLSNYYESDSYDTDHKYHGKCNNSTRIAKDVKEVYDKIPSPVLESHRRHLQEQWKKGHPDAEYE